MLFLIVHYWEVMVDVWPAIVKVIVVTVWQQINQRSRLSKSPLFLFLVGYAILKEFSYLFSAKFTGRKFNRWCHDNWPIGQWVIFHAALDTAYFFFRAWIYNTIQIHSGETGRTREFVARSVATRPHTLKLASLTFKKLWEVNLSQFYQRSNTDFCVHVVV